MEKLKPCPFCGGRAAIISTAERGSVSGDMGTKTTVICVDQNCECGAKIVKWALKKTWAEESARKAWNRRINISGRTGGREMT
ncbi:MAG: Lar family restriction alleviation protein [Clostridiaceae bacterium]|nr:Lar family restriction alleviation protein [Clostridiaceae bacterium]